MAYKQGKEEMNMKRGEEEEKEVKVTHYSSNQQILLVGEGDFSFSLSLATFFGSASNIVATSLDSNDMVVKKYKKAQSNLKQLKKLGASILHGVDATKMMSHSHLLMQKFDRIIFNFPHAGFRLTEDDPRMIKRHTNLVQGFFRNARGMLRPYGEIHVTHKTTPPFCDWNIEELALLNSLVLVKCVDFKIKDYPGYKNKRGSGNKCDAYFHLGKCSTFKFQLSADAKKKSRGAIHIGLMHKDTKQVQVPIQVIPTPMQQERPASFHLHPPTCFSTNISDFSKCKLSSAAFTVERESTNESQSRPIQGIPTPMQQQRPASFHLHPPTSFSTNISDFSTCKLSSAAFTVGRESTNESQSRQDYPASFNHILPQRSFTIDINGFQELESFNKRRESTHDVFDRSFSCALETRSRAVNHVDHSQGDLDLPHSQQYSWKGAFQRCLLFFVLILAVIIIAIIGLAILLQSEEEFSLSRKDLQRIPLDSQGEKMYKVL